MPERIDPKMLIDREHDGDALLLDYSEARAVGEAEELVAVPNEDILGPSLVARGDSNHADRRPFYAVYGFHGRNVARSSPDERVGFIEDEVRRDKRGTVEQRAFESPNDLCVGLIAPVGDCDEGVRVEEDPQRGFLFAAPYKYRSGFRDRSRGPSKMPTIA